MKRFCQSWRGDAAPPGPGSRFFPVTSLVVKPHPQERDCWAGSSQTSMSPHPAGTFLLLRAMQIPALLPLGHRTGSQGTREAARGQLLLPTTTCVVAHPSPPPRGGWPALVIVAHLMATVSLPCKRAQSSRPGGKGTSPTSSYQPSRRPSSTPRS